MMKSVDELSARLVKLEDIFLFKEREVSCLAHNVERLNKRCKEQEKALNDVIMENAELKVAIATNANVHQIIEHLDLDTNQKLNMIEVKCDKNAGDIAVLKQGNPNYTDQFEKIDNNVNSLTNRLEEKKVTEVTHRMIESLKASYVKY